MIFASEKCMCSRCAGKPWQRPPLVPRIELSGIMGTYGGGGDGGGGTLEKAPRRDNGTGVFSEAEKVSMLRQAAERDRAEAKVILEKAREVEAASRAAADAGLTTVANNLIGGAEEDSFSDDDIAIPSSLKGGQIIKKPAVAKNEGTVDDTSEKKTKKKKKQKQ